MLSLLLFYYLSLSHTQSLTLALAETFLKYYHTTISRTYTHNVIKESVTHHVLHILTLTNNKNNMKQLIHHEENNFQFVIGSEPRSTKPRLKLSVLTSSSHKGGNKSRDDGEENKCYDQNSRVANTSKTRVFESNIGVITL